MIIEEIPFFVEFVLLGIVLGFGYGFTKLFLNHAKDKNKVRRTERKQEKDHNLENELDKYLDNAPAIIHHLESEIANLKEKGFNARYVHFYVLIAEFFLPNDLWQWPC